MLTPNDGSTDGRVTAYLSQPDLWRRYDPTLFDALLAASGSEERCVRLADSHDMLPRTRFHEAILPDHVPDRARYFRDMLAAFQGVDLVVDLVFFDPDNGLPIKSRARGRKHSAKHVVLGRDRYHV